MALRLTLTAATLINDALPAGPAGTVVASLRPVAWHLLTLGWATQLIFGVAFWMFPLAGKERPRGDERLAWAAFASLNLGLALRAVGEPALALWPDAPLAPMLPLAAACQVAALWLFVVITW